MYVETFLPGKLGINQKKIERKKKTSKFYMESQKTQNIQSNPEKKEQYWRDSCFRFQVIL